MYVLTCKQTQTRTKSSYKNKKGLLKKVDQLPTGARWIYDIITVTGKLKDLNGRTLTEELELWRRDPLECVAEILGNPALKKFLHYAPVKILRDSVRYYSEMNTGDWWWELQVRITTIACCNATIQFIGQGKLPPGATVSPVILASDKTNLTVLRGDQTAWPVYLTVGNVDKHIRRRPSAHAFVLLGYIPVAKLACFDDKTRSDALYRLFHQCMTTILDPLVHAGREGIPMTCGDGKIRRIFPILAAYIADHPEQCLIACCKENRCPRCLVPPKERGGTTAYPLRSHAATADFLRSYGEGQDVPEYDEQGLRPVFEPFWAALPHTDIFACISPDILHQLHKGIIKYHLLKWCQSLVGEKELDKLFMALPRSHGLRHFTRGVSIISQWTGAKAKELEKVLAGLMVGQVPSRTLRAIRALLDFVYYAQYQCHSDTTLAHMKAALDNFHAYKDEFQVHGVRKHFNIPKLHSLVHYIEAI